MITITTTRLKLRPVCVEDAAAIFAYRSNAEANRYQDWIPKSLEEVKNKFDGKSPAFNQQDTWYQLVIIENATGQLIGDIGIHIMEEGSEAVELGCTLDVDHQGKGYATEAIRAIIDHLVSNYKKRKVIGSVDPRNSGSIKLLKRLGFQQVAFTKNAFKIRGEVVDDMVFELVNTSDQ